MDVQAAPAEQMRYTRTARNEVYRQFQRLPNPDLVMYVYPHLAAPTRCRFRAIRPCSRCTSACSHAIARRARGGLLMRWRLPWPKLAAPKRGRVRRWR